MDSINIVGIGGTVSPGSSSERALRECLNEVESLGVNVRMFSGEFLKRLPMYDPTSPVRTPEALTFVEELRRASGVILSSAAYHGSIPGMLKNALDYTEDLAQDDRVYFSGLPVGSIVVAKDWQAGGSTLSALRSVVHALRGWPTPFGCVVNTAADGGGIGSAQVAESLVLVAREVVIAARAFESMNPSVV